MADDKIKCSACEAYLEFGGATPGLIGNVGGMKPAMEAMALQIGWRKVGKKWWCRAHG